MIHLYGRDLLQCGFSETRFLTGTALVSLYEIRRPGAKLMIQVVALLTVWVWLLGPLYMYCINNTTPVHVLCKQNWLFSLLSLWLSCLFCLAPLPFWTALVIHWNYSHSKLGLEAQILPECLRFSQMQSHSTNLTSVYVSVRFSPTAHITRVCVRRLSRKSWFSGKITTT